MEVDALDQQQQQQQQHAQDGANADSAAETPEIQVQLSPDDPFDLEAYIAPYTDRRRITRLLFIAKRCPDLRVPAYKLALDAIKETSLDYNLYLSIGNLCKDVELDRNWARDAKKKQDSGFDKLDVELKNYQNNLIKESIRMGYRDIGDFQRRSGDLSAAVRSYTKSKDYCTTAHHLLDMCLNVIDTALDQCAYATVRNYVIKGESALASFSGPSKGSNEAGGSSRGVSLPGMLASAQPGKREEEARSKHYQMMSEKLSVANAIANLGQRDFDKAARGFLNVSPPPVAGSGSASSSSSRENASTGTAHYIPPADIGLYGVLTAMASFSRTQFKRLVVDNSNLRPYLEHTPFLKELIQQYYNSRFLAALDILNQNMTRLQLDVHLAAHVEVIMAKIQDKIVELYFEPFSSVKIDKMASAMGWDAATLEAAVVRLIEAGSMKARIDKRAQTIVAHDHNERDTLYEHALKVANDNARSTQMLTYRMRLIQSDVIVDVRKDFNKGQAQKNRREKPGQESQGEGAVQEEGPSKSTGNAITAE